MNMQAIFEEANRRVEALDLSPENDRVADVQQQIANIDEALDKARSRQEEVLILLRPFRDGGNSSRVGEVMEENRRFFADALLSGQSVSDAASGMIDLAALERERESLAEGIYELNNRQRSLQQELSKIRYAAGKRAIEELRPLCEALQDEAREAANVIVRNFGSLSALGRATKSNAPGLIRVGEAAAGVRGAESLVSPGDVLNLPAEIVALVGLLNKKGAAYTGGNPTSVRVRENEGRETAKALTQAIADYDGPETPEMATAKVFRKKWGE